MFASSISAPASRISAGSTVSPLTAVLQSACPISVSPAITSYTVGVFSFTRTPKPLDVLPCGSASTTSTRLPSAATHADRLTLVVVLPTPPFWFVIAMILAMISPSSPSRPDGGAGHSVCPFSLSICIIHARSFSSIGKRETSSRIAANEPARERS